ncbi:MAG TPA: PEGA domain-containing protein [Terriglobales bacterium]|nr:PEGA domain-containing protein [Terriglobales bacterium]
MRSVIHLAVLSLLLIPAAAKTPTSDAQKARVFITDSQSWQITANSGGTSDAHAGHMGGGARPQTAEIIKTFGERCSQVVVNDQRDKADYVVVLDHEGGKSILAHDNKVAVFNSDGDAIVSHSTRSLGNSVKDACEAITKDWPSRASRASAQKPAAQLVTVSDNSATPSVASKIAVSSTPANADIMLDGSFVGNTPSEIDVTPGDHTLTLSKSGFKVWERKVKATGGNVNINAELESQGQ